LRGVADVSLAPGASRHVVITLARNAFTYFNGHALVVSNGAYNVSVGTSSADLVVSQSINVA